MRIACALALGMVTLSGCAHKRTARSAPVPPPPAPARPGTTKKTETARSRETVRTAPAPATPAARPPASASRIDEAPAEAPYVETGKASWYGHPYHGRIAANGERYDMEKMTAAHRTLPFDTWVHVVNLANDKAVDVRITDRGPFVDGRIIDLSHAAARALDLIGPGTAEVRLEVGRLPEAAGKGSFAVQVGAFRDKNNAERERARMAEGYGSARIVLREGEPSLWRVLVGAETTPEGADALRVRIHADSGERNGFVVRLDF